MAHFIEDFGSMRISYDQEMHLREYIAFPRGFNANDFSTHIISTVRLVFNQYIHAIHGSTVTCDMSVRYPSEKFSGQYHTLTFSVRHAIIGDVDSPVLIYVDEQPYGSIEAVSNLLFTKFVTVMAAVLGVSYDSLVNGTSDY